MGEAKFTKGPWRVRWGGECRAIIATGGNAIMGNAAYYPWTPQSGHDWKLIAAAPEMYEMLESARNELYALIDEVNDQRASRITSTTETEPDYHDQETLYLIDKILAKARGES